MRIYYSLFYYRCGKCRRYMKYVSAKPARLYCSSCDDTYTLPQNGNIKLYQELKCPLDDFEMVLWTTGARGKVSILVMYNILSSIHSKLKYLLKVEFFYWSFFPN